MSCFSFNCTRIRVNIRTLCVIICLQMPTDLSFEAATKDLSTDEFDQVFGEMLPSMAEAENASLLVLTLNKLRKLNSGFWYKLWTDSNNTLTGAVWQTARQRERLAAFGQTIFYDATCSTNKVLCTHLKSLKCKHLLMQVGYSYWAPRCLNSEGHSRTIFNGLTLSEDHSIQYEMLASVKERNSEWKPAVIFGDRAVSEDAVIDSLGENVKLFFCLWHITSQNMPQHWGKLKRYTEMSSRFRTLAESRTESEYQQKHDSFQHDFPEGQTWLNGMHEIRTKWVLAWQMNSLTLGYRGTSVAESGNHASKAYLPHQQEALKDTSGMTNVLRGSLMYENEMIRQENKHQAELEIKITNLTFADNIYLMTIFKAGYSKFVCLKWGEEHKKVSMPTITEKHQNARFDIVATSSKTGKSFPYRVERKSTDEMFQCTCHKVPRYGYPCSHLLAVLKEVYGPQSSTTGLCDTRYIHPRWKQEMVSKSYQRDLQMALC